MKSKMPSKKVAVNNLPSNNFANLNSMSNANQQMLGNMQVPQMQMQMKPVPQVQSNVQVPQMQIQMKPVPQVQSNVQTSTPIPPPARSIRGGVYGSRRNVP